MNSWSACVSPCKFVVFSSAFETTQLVVFQHITDFANLLYTNIVDEQLVYIV